MTQPGPPPSTWAPWRLSAAAAVLALAALAFSGLAYWRYAAVWLRRPPIVPACVLRARVALRDAPLVSGTEPHDDAEGNTVYLNEAEDKAVRCVAGVSSELGAQFTSAFAEIEPERRALELLKVLRDRMPRDTAHDRDATVAYLVADAGIEALPKLPETKAALEELQLLHACRFGKRRSDRWYEIWRGSACPTRPPMPSLVWLLGVPSLLAVVAFVALGAITGVRRLVGWIKSRRRAKEPVAPAPTT